MKEGSPLDATKPEVHVEAGTVLTTETTSKTSKRDKLSKKNSKNSKNQHTSKNSKKDKLSMETSEKSPGQHTAKMPNNPEVTDPTELAADEESGEPRAGLAKLQQESEEQLGGGCTGKRTFCMCVLLIAIAAAVVTPVYFLVLKDSDETDGIARVSNFKSGDVISQIPEDICNEGVPGEGKSKLCSVQDTVARGGALCNLVAQAMMNSTNADIALINAGICQSDIAAPKMKVADISAAVQMKKLVSVDMSGGAILKLLEDAMESTFGSSPDYEAYPYAAGLRYGVSSNLEFNSRVVQAEIDVDHLGLWRPINPRRFYTVVTTSELAEGGFGYNGFAEVIDDWKTGLRFSTGDAFLNYALQGDWWKLDAVEYSTQSFVSPDVEPRIASVPQNICLEWAPGTGKSQICAPGVTPKGGGACNLVAWGLLDQNLRADMAILKAGDCGSDLASGKFTENKASTLIPANPSLVTVKLTGLQIVDILEHAVDATIRLEGARSDAYPYSGALRFNVDTTASLENRISSVELYTSSNRWIQLDSSSTYTILTTSELATGKDPDYQGFLQADASSIRPTTLGSVDTFIKYAVEWDILYDPPTEKYSTQSYIS